MVACMDLAEVQAAHSIVDTKICGAEKSLLWRSGRHFASTCFGTSPQKRIFIQLETTVFTIV